MFVYPSLRKCPEQCHELSVGGRHVFNFSFMLKGKLEKIYERALTLVLSVFVKRFCRSLERRYCTYYGL